MGPSDDANTPWRASSPPRFPRGRLPRTTSHHLRRLLSLDSHQIQNVFKGLGEIDEIRSDVGDTWFVTMKDEESAKDAVLKLRLSGAKLKGHPVKARLKSANLLRAMSPPSRQGFRSVGTNFNQNDLADKTTTTSPVSMSSMHPYTAGRPPYFIPPYMSHQPMFNVPPYGGFVMGRPRFNNNQAPRDGGRSRDGNFNNGGHRGQRGSENSRGGNNYRHSSSDGRKRYVSFLSTVV